MSKVSIKIRKSILEYILHHYKTHILKFFKYFFFLWTLWTLTLKHYNLAQFARKKCPKLLKVMDTFWTLQTLRSIYSLFTSSKNSSVISRQYSRLPRSCNLYCEWSCKQTQDKVNINNNL